MDLAELKKLIALAKRSGLKSLSADGISLEFHKKVHEVRTRRRLKAVPGEKAGMIVPPPDPGPTLDQINDYIYGQTDEAI